MDMKTRPGQVAIYLLLTLVAVCVLALTNVDALLAVRAKNRLQNAGDAAALAAAREQGRLLNEIGRLNLEHVQAAIRGDKYRCEAIVREQRRLALLGPFDALRAADALARTKYGLRPRGEFADVFRLHVSDIADKYASAPDVYPPSWPDAWRDYLQEWLGVANGELAVGPDNIEFFDTVGGHLLFNRDFYYAIAAQNWCWFHFNAMGPLLDSTGHAAWSNPFETPRREPNCANSEVFSLHVEPRQTALTDLFAFDEIKALLADSGGLAPFLDKTRPPPLLTNDTQVWFCFDGNHWGRWFDGRRLADGSNGAEFPLDGEMKESLNVRGCSAVCRVRGDVPATAQETTNTHTWVAAAKPFGKLPGDEPVTAANGFVLPVFTDVRLIPVDAANGSDRATADYDWIVHQQRHLPRYLQSGPSPGVSCWYCRQLQTWERESFHALGVNWLKYNAASCVRPMGGTSAGGGTGHGH